MQYTNSAKSDVKKASLVQLMRRLPSFWLKRISWYYDWHQKHAFPVQPLEKRDPAELKWGVLINPHKHFLLNITLGLSEVKNTYLVVFNSRAGKTNEHKYTKKGGDYMLNIADHSYTFPLHEMEELNVLGEN